MSKWLIFGDWAIGLSGDESVYVQYLLVASDKFPKETDSVLEVFDFLRLLYAEHNLGQQRGNDTSTSYGVDGVMVHVSGRMWDFDSTLALSEVPAGRTLGCRFGR